MRCPVRVSVSVLLSGPPTAPAPRWGTIGGRAWLLPPVALAARPFVLHIPRGAAASGDPAPS